MRRLLRGKALPNVTYAYIFDNKGRIVGDYNEDQHQLLSTFTDELGQKIVNSTTTLVDIDSKKHILDISKPVNLGHERLGGIRLGFDLGPVIQDIQEATFKAVGISSAIFLVGLGIIFMITLRMIKPIETLTLAANRIEEGDLQFRVNIVRDDESVRLQRASIGWPTV